MQKTDAEFLAEANIIKNETNAGANTATRVGVMLVDIVDSKINNTSGGGVTPTLDNVLTVGNNSIQSIFLQDSLTNTTVENQFTPYYNYMYDAQGGEAEINTSQFYCYAFISGQDVYVQGQINGGNPFFEVKNGVTSENAKLTQNSLQFSGVSLYPPANSGVFKTEEVTNNIDTTTQDTPVNGNTINEVIAAGAFKIIFPDPQNNYNQRITIVNTDLVNPVLFDDTNTFAPYWNGSNSKITSLGSGQMLVLTSVNGKWRGGLMYD